MRPDVSPTGRALLALELIQSRPGITAEALGERLGVSERAARRYVGILRETGIPIDAVRGPHGGYRAGRGLRLPPLMFSSAEALGLVMAALDGHHAVNDPGDPVGSALAKIVRVLPGPVAAQTEAIRRAASSVPDRGAARPDPGTTAVLVEACAGRHRVRIGYRSEAGNDWVAELEPWAVVVRHSRWYLLCRSLRAGATRAYRVDRVTSVETLDEEFTPPADLDAAALLEEHLAVGWEFEVEVEVDLPLEQLRGWLPRSLGRLEAVDDGRCRLVGSTSNPGWYVEQLAAVPGTYRILGSPEVREAARRLGERLLAAASGT